MRRELLAELASYGVPCALVTMSYRRFVAPVLAALPAETFRVVVTGDAVSHGKPHPEPYLKAAQELRVDPADCLAIEDSNTGARSAEAAGLRGARRAEPRPGARGRPSGLPRLPRATSRPPGPVRPPVGAGTSHRS